MLEIGILRRERKSATSTVILSTMRSATTSSRSADRHKSRNSDDPLTWSLPGEGIKDPSCGVWSARGCLSSLASEHPNSGYVKGYKYDCGKRDCPESYLKWILKETEADVRRIKIAKELYKLRGVSHIELSPPTTTTIATVGEYRALRKDANMIIRLVGYMGGLLCPHPFRCHDKDGNRLGGAALRDPDNVRVPGFHFHAFVDGWNTDTAAVFEATGWTVRRIGFIHSDRQLKKAISYVLEHVGIPNIQSADPEETETNLHAVTWFGNMSYSALVLPLVPEIESERCICGLPMVPLRYVGPLPDPPEISASGEFVDLYDWAIKWDKNIDKVLRPVRLVPWTPPRTPRHYKGTTAKECRISGDWSNCGKDEAWVKSHENDEA